MLFRAIWTGKNICSQQSPHKPCWGGGSVSQQKMNNPTRRNPRRKSRNTPVDRYTPSPPAKKQRINPPSSSSKSKAAMTSPAPATPPNKGSSSGPLGFQIPTSLRGTEIERSIHAANRILQLKYIFYGIIAQTAGMQLNAVDQVMKSIPPIRVKHIDLNATGDFQAYASTDRTKRPPCIDLEKLLVDRVNALNLSIRSAKSQFRIQELELELTRLVFIVAIALCHEVAHLILRAGGKLDTPPGFRLTGSTDAEVGDFFENHAFQGGILAMHNSTVQWGDTSNVKVVDIILEVQNSRERLDDQSMRDFLDGLTDDFLINRTPYTPGKGQVALKSQHPDATHYERGPQIEESEELKVLRRVRMPRNYGRQPSDDDEAEF
jgi:hypothetical protein